MALLAGAVADHLNSNDGWESDLSEQSLYQIKNKEAPVSYLMPTDRSKK